MPHVYIMRSEKGYNARFDDSTEKYLSNLELGEKIGEKLVHMFTVEEGRARDVFRVAINFSSSYNSGKKPRLQDLESAVNRLTVRKGT